jgi:uncharacterized protein YqeY
MILDTLKSKLIEAQKAKDELRVSVLRFLFSAIKNKEIELRPQNQVLDDEKIFAVIKKQIKMRKDSIESYKAGNRQDLVDKETNELNVLEEYLALQTPVL